MQFIADLHIHSHYSRTTSGDLVPEQLAFWAQKKGITLVGSGDFTHMRTTSRPTTAAHFGSQPPATRWKSAIAFFSFRPISGPLYVLIAASNVHSPAWLVRKNDLFDTELNDDRFIQPLIDQPGL
jgi:hypothetical protein